MAGGQPRRRDPRAGEAGRDLGDEGPAGRRGELRQRVDAGGQQGAYCLPIGKFGQFRHRCPPLRGGQAGIRQTQGHIAMMQKRTEEAVDHFAEASALGSQSPALLEDLARAQGLRFAALRYFNAAGACPEEGIGERHTPETHAIPLALFVLLGRRLGFKIFGADYDTRDGSCLRDYVHVLDLADAHVRAVERLLGGGASLAVNLGTAILASIVISFFGAAIEQVVALAVLMPIVASMGGNAGTQTLTVAVRSLAMRDLTPSNAVRIIWRETIVGGLNGVLFAIIMGALAGVWHSMSGHAPSDALKLGVVIGAAMTINLVAAGLAGILVPLGLQRAGADPAVASAVFVTTVTDVVGFFVFLGLAAVVLL